MLLAMMVVGLAATAQVLNIGGHRAVHDNLNNIWLCSVPKATFGEDFSAVVNYGEELTGLTIGGVAVGNGDVVVFEDVEGLKEYSVTATMGDSVITGAITFTWLPVVELNGTFDYTYTMGTVTVSEPDSAFAQPLMAKVKWRGGATNTKRKNKRNYRIKFVNEDSTKMNRRFFGLRDDNSWLLDAGQMDFLRVRNRVSTDLWLDMARRPWYADSLPNVHNGSRGQMVEVLLNGSYVGIYNMCEPIDRKQMKLKRYDEENKVFHGLLWTGFKWSHTVTMSSPAPRSPRSDQWDGFEQKYPDKDEIGRVNWTALERAVYFANRSQNLKKLRADSMGYYFDLPVMQDYYIFIVTLQALDNESKNIYYACYDTQDNNRLTMVPWDLDVCLGQNYAPGINMPEMVMPEREVDWIYHLPMAGMMRIKSYNDEVLARYKELRKTVLNTDSLVNRYRAAVDELGHSGAATREELRWSGDTDLAGKELNIEQEMEYVEDWIRRRMAFLDEHVFVEMVEPHYIKGDVNGDGEVSIADINTLIDIILGGNADEDTMIRADVNGDEEISLSDINVVIDILLQ